MKRELHRSVLAKLYKGLNDWPIEDREDWITLHVSELYSLFSLARSIARSEAIDHLYKRFDIKSRAPKRGIGHSPGALNKRHKVT